MGKLKSTNGNNDGPKQGRGVMVHYRGRLRLQLFCPIWPPWTSVHWPRAGTGGYDTEYRVFNLYVRTNVRDKTWQHILLSCPHLLEEVVEVCLDNEGRWHLNTLRPLPPQLVGVVALGPGKVQGVGDDVPPGLGDQAAGGEEAGKWHLIHPLRHQVGFLVSWTEVY